MNDLKSIEQSVFYEVLIAALKLGLDGEEFTTKQVLAEMPESLRQGQVLRHLGVVCGLHGIIMKDKDEVWRIKAESIMMHLQFVAAKTAADNAEKALEHSEGVLKHSEKSLKIGNRGFWIAVAGIIISVLMLALMYSKPVTLNEDQFNEVKTRMERIEKAPIRNSH